MLKKISNIVMVVLVSLSLNLIAFSNTSTAKEAYCHEALESCINQCGSIPLWSEGCQTGCWIGFLDCGSSTL